MIAERKVRADIQFGASGVAEYRDNSGQAYIKARVLEGEKEIPVYSIRNRDHHESIARLIASGKPVAFNVHVIGVLIAVQDPRGRSDNWREFWRIKNGREPQDKVPFMMLPRHQYRVVDFEKVHQYFRYLKNPDKRREFYGRLPLHVIYPVKQNAAFIHQNAFITTFEDTLKKPEDQRVAVPTICVFSQADSDWEHVAERAARLNHHALFGVTSFNDHGEQPPFNKAQFMDYIGGKGVLDVEGFVDDEFANGASSHTQIRLPLVGERPELVVVRRGLISADLIKAQTGHEVRVLESAKVASRGHPPEANLDNLFFGFIQDVDRHERLRKSSNGHRDAL